MLALDHGTVRIGVAVSDPLGITAQPHAVLDVAPGLMDRIGNLADELDVEQIVIGLPTGLDGTEGEAAHRAREFADEVGRATGRPVELVDERFSTVIAERAMIDGGARRDRRRGTRDSVAAAVFLQSYLDRP